MEIAPRRFPLRTRTTVLGIVAATALFGACSDDGDVESELSDVLVDEDFPGDAFDAACARLEAAEGGTQEERAARVLDELIALGDEATAIETLELATVDKCPDWTDAVTAAVAARS